MKKLNLNSLDFRSEDQKFRVTISWDGEESAILPLTEEKLNIIETKAYELNNEQMKFARKYHLPFKQTYYSQEEINKFILLLEEYKELVLEVEAFTIYWDFTKFDFEGLKKVVEESIRKRSNTEIFVEEKQ